MTSIALALRRLNYASRGRRVYDSKTTSISPQRTGVIAMPSRAPAQASIAPCVAGKTTAPELPAVTRAAAC